MVMLDVEVRKFNMQYRRPHKSAHSFKLEALENGGLRIKTLSSSLLDTIREELEY